MGQTVDPHPLEPEYGEDAYALGSCLSGKALDIIIGIEDDYEKIWKRLNTVFGDPEIIVDSVLSELRSLTPVKDDDPAGLITMIIVVERCWLGLQRLKVEREMNTSTMITVIERLLPLTQNREWVVYKQRVLNRSDTDKFEELTIFVRREKGNRIHEYRRTSKCGTR